MHKTCNMDIVELLDRLEELRVTRALRDRINPFKEFTDEEFKNRYRLYKKIALSLFNLIADELQLSTTKNKFVPPFLQIAIAMRFYAKGNFQITDGDLIGVSQLTVCRTIHRVSREIAKNKKHFIKFPLGKEAQLVEKTFQFSNEMPGVVGCIDCSHIPIISPGGEDAELYRNRKGYFSLNVQAVCDTKLMFTNIVCRWLGSTHDSRIFDNSALCSQFRNRLINGTVSYWDMGAILVATI